MGVARLLAKGWIVFCLFAGAHALDFALRRGESPLQAAPAIAICVILFAAMGLLRTRFELRRLRPGFDGAVFFGFVAGSFAVQTYFITAIGGSIAAQALQKALYFVVPGLAAMVTRLGTCSLVPPNVYSLSLASAVAWLLAIIFLASAASRIRLTAGLLRLERALHPMPFSPTVLAALYGAVAIVAFQLLYVGSAYSVLPCKAFFGVNGAVLIGLAPLLLSYLIFAALTALAASGPESHDRQG
jgi:hypothetical protein